MNISLIEITDDESDKQEKSPKVYTLISDEFDSSSHRILQDKPKPDIDYNSQEDTNDNEVRNSIDSVELEAPYKEDDTNKTISSVVNLDTSEFGDDFSKLEKTGKTKGILDRIISEDFNSINVGSTENSRTSGNSKSPNTVADKLQAFADVFNSQKEIFEDMQSKIFNEKVFAAAKSSECERSSPQREKTLFYHPTSSPIASTLTAALNPEESPTTVSSIAQNKEAEKKQYNDTEFDHIEFTMSNDSNSTTNVVGYQTSTQLNVVKNPSIKLIVSNKDQHLTSGLVKKPKQFSKKSALEKYILRGKDYTVDESKRLIDEYLSTNSKALKSINQNCKDNEKARSKIIMELSENLKSFLESECPNMSELIQPATVQCSFAEKLPMIKFLRRCNSIYDFVNDVFYPAEMKILDESVYLLYFDALDFFEQYRNERSKIFRELQLHTRLNKHLILVLFDLNKLKKDLETLENTVFKAKVNQQLQGSPSKKQHLNPRLQRVKHLNMKKADMEQRVRYIDRKWNIKIHTVTSHIEFVNSLPNLISLIGKQRSDPSIRHMNYAHLNVKSAQSPDEVTKKVFHEIGKMPDLKASSVTRTYPNLQLLLEDFEKGQLKAGLDGRHIFTESMEKRLFEFLTNDDPNAIID